MVEGPAFAVWNGNDHSGPVMIVTILCMFYWLAPGITQQALSFVRVRFTWADSCFTATMIVGVIQSTLVLVACHYGLGKSADILQRESVEQAERFYYASNIFYVLTLGLVKCSAALFVANLTVKNMGSLRSVSQQQKRILFPTLAIALAWTIAATIAVAIPCDGRSICIGTVARWEGIFAFDAVTDIAIAVFAATVIWPLKATLEKRLLWYIPFCLRMCVPLWAGLRLLTINHAKLTNDPTIGLWLFVILGQCQILFSLIGAALPAINKTMMDLVTNYNSVGDTQAGSKGMSLPLRYLNSKLVSNQDPSMQRSMDSKKPGFTPFVGGVRGSAMVSRSNTSKVRTGDGDSQEGIIRQDEYHVDYSRMDSRMEDRGIGSEQD